MQSGKIKFIDSVCGRININIVGDELVVFAQQLGDRCIKHRASVKQFPIFRLLGYNSVYTSLAENRHCVLEEIGPVFCTVSIWN
jgi:hypothetical protein